MPLRLSLPLLLSVFAGLFTLLLTTFQLPSSIEAAGGLAEPHPAAFRPAAKQPERPCTSRTDR